MPPSEHRVALNLMSTDLLKDLELLLRSRYRLISIETVEEDRAETLLRHLADHLRLPLFVWTRTKGLRRTDLKEPVYHTTDVAQALAHIEHAGFAAVYHLQGVAGEFQDPAQAARLKEAVLQFPQSSGAIVVSGSDVSLHDSVRPLAACISMPPPALQDYRDLLLEILKDLAEKMPVRVEISQREIDMLLHNLKGLTLMEAEKILTKIIVEDGALSASDIRAALEAKKGIVQREGLLEYYPAREAMEAIADLAGLKSWLAKRRQFLADRAGASKFGLSFPKGVLLLGVQGCGKSLCAKAVAMEWNLPLLKLDPSGLYNKYIGESERNFRRAMQMAERLAPVVLWIDEIEKAFSAGAADQDGGVSHRILGSFLSWLQDRQGDVFVVATANDIARLPPELMRKGRFDEIFFVDLPTAEARREVFRIHLRKRDKDPALFDLDRLTASSEGFSPAEIEQAITSALYSAFSNKAELTTELLLQEIAGTRPLSQTMAERIEDLRQWARERTVSAQ